MPLRPSQQALLLQLLLGFYLKQSGQVEVVDVLQPALDMCLTVLDSLPAVGPSEESDHVGEDNPLPLAGKGNLEVEVDGHLVREDSHHFVADSFQAVADSLQVQEGKLQGDEDNLQAVVGELQVEEGKLQAEEGRLQFEGGKLQGEQNHQGLGRACVQSRPFPHCTGAAASVISCCESVDQLSWAIAGGSPATSYHQQLTQFVLGTRYRIIFQLC